MRQSFFSPDLIYDQFKYSIVRNGPDMSEQSVGCLIIHAWQLIDPILNMLFDLNLSIQVLHRD